ncbi:hypothetical protein SteCoe_23512 [Stentor coeruleus]|uniref:Uncharacterized protein n=1 Tax=Stentor coeruleus TaxID=5963 RepID=A0A1R2BK59_9CILI|nr:hypothetical protein SteCoe_23512 [Stentor coeruleus]
MQKCRICTNLSDFSCHCREDITYICYKHSPEHLNHKDLFYIPNPQILVTKFPELIMNLNAKKQELSDLILEAENITEKCIQNIYTAFEKAQTVLNQSIDDLNKAIEILLNTRSDQEYNYISLYSLVFEENYEIFDASLVMFIDNYKKIEKWAGKLFNVVSYSGNYLKNFKYIREDKEFIRKENERRLILTQAKSKKKSFKELSGTINLVKNRSHKMKLMFHNINEKYNQDEFAFTSNMLSLCCTNINQIKLTNVKLTDSQFNLFVQSLKQYTYVKSLELNDSIMNTQQILALSEYLKHPKNLKNLSIPNNAVCDEGINILLASLSEYTILKVIDLSQNFITVTGVKILNQILPQFYNLRELNLNNNKLEIGGAMILSKTLKNLLNLECLFINRNKMMCEGITYIIKSICFLPHLCILDMWGNDIFDEGGLFLAEHLKYMLCLNRLYIDLVMGEDVKQIIAGNAVKICKIIGKNETNRLVIKVPEFM